MSVKRLIHGATRKGGVDMLAKLCEAILELDRNVNNIVRYGNISSVSVAKKMVKVILRGGEADDIIDPDDTAEKIITSGWLPWISTRAGKTRAWSPPDIGEQVLIVSEGGKFANAIVLPSAYRDKFPIVGATATNEIISYSADGQTEDIVVTVEKGANPKYTIDVKKATGEQTFKVGANTEIHVKGTEVSVKTSTKFSIEVGTTKLELTTTGAEISCGAEKIKMGVAGTQLTTAKFDVI